MYRIFSCRLRALFLAVPFSLALANPAAAQPSGDVPPSTLTLDRMDAATRIGIQVGFDKIDGFSLDDLSVMRFEPYGQYVLPGKDIGIYGHIPIAHAFGPDATGVGNLGLGAFFLPSRNSALILRAGLILPTASDTPERGQTNVLSAYERMTDFMMVAPKYTMLRLSASTVQEAEYVFFRADLGLDLALDKPSGGAGVFLRANLAAGVRTPLVDISLELVNIGDLDGGGDLSQRFMHTLAGGFRTRGQNQACAGMVFPLDKGPRGEIWIVTFGYQYAMN
jgi:hypothetical protein